MGGGTSTAREHEEPAVETEASLTGELEVDLDPEDVWTLGQLIEANAVSFPPNVAEELMTGYRILQASGYEPPEHVDSRVQLRGSGERDAIDVSLEDIEEADVSARRVFLTEIVSDDEHHEADGTVEPGVNLDDRPDPRGHDDAQAGLGSIPVDAFPGPEQVSRLADAIEDLSDALDDTQFVDPDASEPEPRTRDSGLMDRDGALVLDWALIGLGLGISTMLVLAAAVIADPVFAILGIALLIMCVFQSVPYLVEDSEEGPL